MKLSAAILDYAKPVLDALPPDTPFETRREMLSFTIVIWNALVAARTGRPDLLEKLRSRLDALPGSDIIVNAYDQLVARKRERHAADDRFVGDWELRTRSDGSLSLRTQARR